MNITNQSNFCIKTLKWQIPLFYSIQRLIADSSQKTKYVIGFWYKTAGFQMEARLFKECPPGLELQTILPLATKFQWVRIQFANKLLTCISLSYSTYQQLYRLMGVAQYYLLIISLSINTVITYVSYRKYYIFFTEGCYNSYHVSMFLMSTGRNVQVLFFFYP